MQPGSYAPGHVRPDAAQLGPREVEEGAHRAFSAGREPLVDGPRVRVEAFETRERRRDGADRAQALRE